MKELTMSEVEEVSGGRRPNGPVNGHAGGVFKISRLAVTVVAVATAVGSPPITIGRAIAGAIAGVTAWNW